MDTQNDLAIELLKAELDVIELDDRLEMVSLSGIALLDVAPESGSNGVCCCS